MACRKRCGHSFRGYAFYLVWARAALLSQDATRYECERKSGRSEFKVAELVLGRPSTNPYFVCGGTH